MGDSAADEVLDYEAPGSHDRDVIIQDLLRKYDRLERDNEWLKGRFRAEGGDKEPTTRAPKTPEGNANRGGNAEEVGGVILFPSGPVPQPEGRLLTVLGARFEGSLQPQADFIKDIVEAARRGQTSRIYEAAYSRLRTLDVAREHGWQLATELEKINAAPEDPEFDRRLKRAKASLDRRLALSPPTKRPRGDGSVPFQAGPSPKPWGEGPRFGRQGDLRPPSQAWGAGGPTCFVCGQQGHIARGCPANIANAAGSATTPGAFPA